MTAPSCGPGETTSGSGGEKRSPLDLALADTLMRLKISPRSERHRALSASLGGGSGEERRKAAEKNRDLRVMDLVRVATITLRSRQATRPQKAAKEAGEKGAPGIAAFSSSILARVAGTLRALLERRGSRFILGEGRQGKAVLNALICIGKASGEDGPDAARKALLCLLDLVNDSKESSQVHYLIWGENRGVFLSMTEKIIWIAPHDFVAQNLAFELFFRVSRKLERSKDKEKEKDYKQLLTNLPDQMRSFILTDISREIQEDGANAFLAWVRQCMMELNRCRKAPPFSFPLSSAHLVCKTHEIDLGRVEWLDVGPFSMTLEVADLPTRSVSRRQKEGSQKDIGDGSAYVTLQFRGRERIRRVEFLHRARSLRFVIPAGTLEHLNILPQELGTAHELHLTPEDEESRGAGDAWISMRLKLSRGEAEFATLTKVISSFLPPSSLPNAVAGAGDDDGGCGEEMERYGIAEQLLSTPGTPPTQVDDIESETVTTPGDLDVTIVAPFKEGQDIDQGEASGSEVSASRFTPSLRNQMAGKGEQLPDRNPDADVDGSHHEEKHEGGVEDKEQLEEEDGADTQLESTGESDEENDAGDFDELNGKIRALLAAKERKRKRLRMEALCEEARSQASEYIRFVTNKLHHYWKNSMHEFVEQKRSPIAKIEADLIKLDCINMEYKKQQQELQDRSEQIQREMLVCQKRVKTLQSLCEKSVKEAEKSIRAEAGGAVKRMTNMHAQRKKKIREGAKNRSPGASITSILVGENRHPRTGFRW